MRKQKKYSQKILEGSIRIRDVPFDVRTQQQSIYIYAIRHIRDSVYSGREHPHYENAYTEYCIIEKFLLDDIIKTDCEVLANIHSSYFSEKGYDEIFHYDVSNRQEVKKWTQTKVSTTVQI